MKKLLTISALCLFNNVAFGMEQKESPKPLDVRFNQILQEAMNNEIEISEVKREACALINRLIGFEMGIKDGEKQGQKLLAYRAAYEAGIKNGEEQFKADC